MKKPLSLFTILSVLSASLVLAADTDPAVPRNQLRLGGATTRAAENAPGAAKAEDKPLSDTVPVPQNNDVTPEGADSQDGVWKLTAAVIGGVKLPKPALDAITLTVSGTNYEVTAKGEQHSDIGTHTLDTTTEPKRITIKSTEGANKGKTFLGIYEMKDANSMRVCYDLTGAAFPTKFESTAETGHYLAEYRRVEAKAPPNASDAAADAKRQNGRWRPAGAMLGGTKLTGEELGKVTLTIKDGAYEMVGDSKGLAEGEATAVNGTVTLDTSVAPKRMTIQGVDGPNKGKTILAIYEMGENASGDTFRVCYDLSGKAFPTEFKSSKGSTHYLVGYRRQKDAPSGVPENKKERP